jgi:hypothetical protein
MQHWQDTQQRTTTQLFLKILRNRVVDIYIHSLLPSCDISFVFLSIFIFELIPVIPLSPAAKK